MAKVKFKWNKPIKEILSDVGMNRKTNLYLAETCYKEMNKYTPMDTGMLSQDVTIEADENSGTITYNVPYAKRLFRGTGFNFNKEKHALAQAHWDKPLRENPQKIAKQMQQYIERNSNRNG